MAKSCNSYLVKATSMCSGIQKFAREDHAKYLCVTAIVENLPCDRMYPVCLRTHLSTAGQMLYVAGLTRPWRQRGWHCLENITLVAKSCPTK